MQSLTLIFTNEALCAAFCTWYARCLGSSHLEKTSDPRCVQVTFPRQLLRTVMTVAQHNRAVVEAV